MKVKKLFLLIIVLSAFGSIPAFSQDFAYIENLSPVQKQQLSRVYQAYKQENNSLEMRIINYKDKLIQLQDVSDISVEQIELLRTSYERNIKVLTTEQERLKAQTEQRYKNIMSPEQYKQYLAQQMQVENAFNEFLRK